MAFRPTLDMARFLISEVRQRLKLRGEVSRTLVVTRVGDKPVAFVCRRIKETSEARSASD